MSQESMFSAAGQLYVVATPIGNLEDITARALRILAEVDVIAAEDTRHTQRLLQHFMIKTPLVACHDHNEREEGGRLVQRLLTGESIALVSDAGTPLISDPGFHLVKQAQQAGVQVVPVPGVSAVITALSAAGLPSDRFSFEGFLPAKAIARQAKLNELKEETQTLIFYEAPHRILECVSDCAEIFGGERMAVLARELTKTFETIRQLPLAELKAWIASDTNQQRGECVLLIAGADKADSQELSSQALQVMRLLMQEMPLKKAAHLAAEITGARKNALYQWGLTEKSE